MSDTPLQRAIIEPFPDGLIGNGKVKVSVKREDLIHPFISGNKWRKLKYVLQAASMNGANHLVSFGGPWSNHILALACAGAMHGFKTTGIIRGEPVNNHVLSLCKLWGMNLVFVSRSAYLNKHELFESMFEKDASAFFIDEGGRGIEGMRGCEEILGQDISYTHVICAVGTGTTIAGIAKGIMNSTCIAEGILVLKGEGEIDKEIEMMAGFPVKIHHGFSRRGYGKADEELLNFIKKIASQTGILTDHVYTGKMMMAVDQLINEGYYPEGSDLLLIHTGGITGLLGVI